MPERLAPEDVDALLEESRKAGRADAAVILRERWRDAYLAAAARPRAPVAGTAWWVYGVIADDDAGALPDGVAGVEHGGTVRAIASGRLAALASEVPLSDFGDEQLRRHLEDLDWVERVARAHEHVLETVMAGCSVVPLRLCTICLDTKRVAALVDERAPTFADALQALRGHSEWGVKVFAAPLATASKGGEDADDPQAYLERKRQARDHREHAHERALAGAEQVHQAFSSIAAAAVVNAPQHREAHGRDADMVLNGAYLVPDARRAQLDEVADRLATELAPLAVELTGPWPAYNFVASSV